jgi:hypothetical protein
VPRFFGFFIPSLGDLDLRLGGCGTRVIRDLFFKSVGRFPTRIEDSKLN